MIYFFFGFFRQQKDEKKARLEELKANAPSDDIFDQLPETFETKSQAARSEKVPVRTEFVEDEEEELETEETPDFLSLDTSSKKRKVKRVKLRQEIHGSTQFQIMSKQDQKGSLHISQSVLNFKKAKLSGHLSKIQRQSAAEREQRQQKIKVSGKDIRVA